MTKRHFFRSLIAGAAVFAASTPALAEDVTDASTEAVGFAESDGASDVLLTMPLEELLTLESTSVAKKRQRISDSAAAVYVLTQEDIARSPATTIPRFASHRSGR